MHEQALILPNRPTLKDYQEYLARVVKERGFDQESIQDLFLLFLEECGELAKAARKVVHLKSGAHSETYRVDHEAADVFIFLIEICNVLGVDLEKAFREKEEINKRRHWV